jgi:hypothetical protein
LYSGLLDPRVTYQDVSGFSFYADEILVINPFPNPNIIQKEYNPIDNPGQYRHETLKNITFMLSLMPLIEAGRVNVIPDPTIFNPALRKQIMDEAEKRRDQVKLDDKATATMEKLAKEDFMRFVFNGSEEKLRAYVKRVNPQISEEEIKEFLLFVKAKNEQDPLAMLHPSAPGEQSGQLIMSHLSPNFELGMFLAQATGSFIVAHHPYRWSEICSSVNYFYGDYSSPWGDIEKHITNFDLDFIHFLDRKDLLSALNDGNLQHLRLALKNIWGAVQTAQPINVSQVGDLIQELNLAREKMGQAIDKFMKRKNEGRSEYLRVARTKGKVSSKIAPAGHSTSAVYRLLLAHAGHDKYLKSLPLSLYVERG